MDWGGRGACGSDGAVQALLQSNARVDAADSDGYVGPRPVTVGVGFTDARVCGRASGGGSGLAWELPLWCGLMAIGVMRMGSVASRRCSAQFDLVAHT